MPLVYVLHIALEDIEPPIWRRLLVPADITLKRLHTVIQRAMGWQDQHLYEFQIAAGRKRHLKVATSRQLWQVVDAGSAFSYVYDFGDGWEHHVLVEAVSPSEPGVVYPRCLAGERACPPEDCGGVPGYADILDAIRDPDRPDAAELLEWVGEDFDPEAFDLDATNLALTRTVRRAARPH